MYISGLSQSLIFFSSHITDLTVFNMRVSTVSAIIGLTAGFASAAPVQPKEFQSRDADSTDNKREAEAQWYGK